MLDALGLELLPVVVVHEELVRRAALDDVGLLEQVGLHVVVRAVVALAGEAGGLHVHADEERGVRPLLGVDVIDEVVLDDDVEPGESQGAVGTGAQVLPVVGLLAHVGLTGVNGDVHVGASGNVDRGTARVVVVGKLGSAAPLDVHLRAGDGLHPGHGERGGHLSGEVARALADLPSLEVVGGLEEGLDDRLGMHAPNTGGTDLTRNGLAAVLLLDLLHLGDDGVHGLVPGDTHPVGVVVALGVGALHGIVQTIGMVGRLNRGLRLGAAVAHRLERALVTLNADGATVLHDDLDTALHLAAATAASLDGNGIGPHDVGDLLSVLDLSQSARRVTSKRRSSSGNSSRLHEVTTREIQLAHTLSFHVLLVTVRLGHAPMWPCALPR